MMKWGHSALLWMREISLMFFHQQRTPITSPINLGTTQRPPLSCGSSAVNKAAWRLLWSTSKRNRASFFHPSLPADCLVYLITIIIHSIRLPRGGPYSSLHSVCSKEQKQPDILTVFICTCIRCNGSLDISCWLINFQNKICRHFIESDLCVLTCTVHCRYNPFAPNVILDCYAAKGACWIGDMWWKTGDWNRSKKTGISSGDRRAGSNNLTIMLKNSIQQSCRRARPHFTNTDCVFRPASATSRRRRLT